MNLSFFYFCEWLAFYSLSAVAYQFSVPLCHTKMFKNEFFIPQPEKCIKHNSFRVHTCRAAVYYPSKHVLQLPITTCEMYKTTSSTTFYFFGAKVSNLRESNYIFASSWAIKCQLLGHSLVGERGLTDVNPRSLLYRANFFDVCLSEVSIFLGLE